ncbi:hypothetical protein CPB85DRAFT_1416260 [Mucidula mucida]|nr:hypothetical protein CPB85DRAFT_1416260 [Mucidula mucida]
MRDFLNDAEYADKQKYHYEDRCLRITVSERLHPITCLTSPREVAQVFLDVLQTHNWLYEVPKILHRDLSQSNIMFRKDKDANVYGVPNDLDLASLLSQIEGESSSTSLRRTGTPPFMAFDLQDPDNSQVRHLYRHDLESLFYVLVMFVCRYEFKGDHYVMRAQPPFDDWFDWTKSWTDLKKTKSDFFHTTDPTFIASQISPGLNHFEPWVLFLQSELREGFVKKAQAQAPIPSFQMDEEMLYAVEAGLVQAPVVEEPEKVDDETLGGAVTYWTFYPYMRHFDGQPLDVRRRKLGFSAPPPL